MPERPRVVVAALVALALVLGACGQKSGVAGTEVSTETPAPTGRGGGGDGGGEPVGHTPGPDDTSGVTDDEIVIGVHAPVTGASPIPQETFNTGKDVYWKFLAESQPEALGGRRVRVVFRDDEFNPNRAVQVCREMVERENAFVLVGGGGADQITACAKYADEAGVPYFSAGVNESERSDLSTYFAVSLTYSQQVPLLLRLVDELEAQRVGVVINDTPSFVDAHESFVEAAEEADLDVVVDDSINKVASEAEALAEVRKLEQARAEVVFLLVSPLVYLSVASAARNQGYDPVFVGPGITNGLNAVTRFGCPAVGNGQFFSPFPELDVIDELDPDFTPAYQQFGGGEPDDIGIALWGLNKNLALMFEATGDDLGRAALMNAIEEGDTFETNVYPPVSFEPDQHFGGSGAHLLEADCSIRQYTTKQQFVELGEGN
jgi:ABC-type branched-subunit amino acid transport system substrate-binding protein